MKSRSYVACDMSCPLGPRVPSMEYGPDYVYPQPDVCAIHQLVGLRPQNTS